MEPTRTGVADSVVLMDGEVLTSSCSVEHTLVAPSLLGSPL